MKYKLKEIFDLQMGKTPARNNDKYWNSKDYKWISIADLTSTDKYINNTKEYISQSAVTESGIKIIPANTVVMSFKLSIGKTAILSEDMYSNEAIMAFHDKHVVELLPEYIYYLIKAKNWNCGSNRAVMGQTLNKATLSAIEVDVHTIDEQRKIVELLNLVGEIIYKRNTQLSKLGDILSARFVEMFGEGLKDDGKFNLKPISEIGQVVSGATPKTSRHEYWNGNNVWITPAELSDESFVIYDSERKLTYEGVDSCAVTLLPVGTVILSSRAPIGKVAIAGVEMYCNQGFKNIIPRNSVSSIYLYELLKMETEYLNSLGRGATFKEISKQIVENIRVKVPPIELQNKFATFVQQVDKSKFEVQKALDKAQLLFDSLMQKYFG